MRKAWVIPIFLCLTGCGIYTSEFQCRPGKGVGCAPVGEVLDMIVESEEGEDQFIKDRPTSRAASSSAIRKAKQPTRNRQPKRASFRSNSQKPLRSPTKKPLPQKILSLTKDETGQLVLKPGK